MKKKIRVRFAPSPTGPLHIGGVRTAWNNYCLAKKEKGTFILRIEDTDRTRFVPGSEQYILDTLAWLGMTPDESPIHGGDHGPYRQSERKDIYKRYAEELVAKGKAYYAFDTPEELEALRSRLKEERVAAPRYNAITRIVMKNSLTLPQEEVARRLASDKPYVIRLSVSPKSIIKLHDEVRGWVQVQGSSLEDKILLKGDGMPTYHLANVVDDHLMEITHVIRGEEWLPSTPTHILLYQYFEWTPPRFAHLPLILREDGQGKLSKRMANEAGTPIFPLTWQDPLTGKASQGFREAGYLPSALTNFLGLLGWHPSGNQEIFRREEMIDAFSLSRINKSGVRFDSQKARWVNQQHIRMMEDSHLAKKHLIPALREKGIETTVSYAEKACRLIKERIHFPQEMLKEGIYLFQAPQVPPIDHTHTDLIAPCRKVITELAPFTPKEVKEAIKRVIAKEGLKIGEGMSLLRLILTGQPKGPDLGEIISLLGREETIKRLKRIR